MKIDCIGCLHGYFPKLDGGDLLIVTGDLTAKDTQDQLLHFLSWISQQEYNKKIWISGNHDGFLEGTKFIPIKKLGMEYLCDSGTEFEGLKIWGSPRSLWFHGVNPKCKAFMGKEKELKKFYDKIPDDIDILITHSPAFGILDENYEGENCGSASLYESIYRINPKILVHSHIHEQGGKQYKFKDTLCINCSIMNEKYKPVNKPITVEL